MWRYLRPDSANVWKDPEVLRRLARYHGIVDGRRWAKYQLAKQYPCEVRLDAESDELWTIHSRLSGEFRDYVSKIDSERDVPPDVEPEGPTFLALNAELATRILKSCHFCERKCGADRTRDSKGWCKLDSDSRVSSAFLHTGEEAPLVPSGTIFFASCCFGCVFCQNQDISTNPRSGTKVSQVQLAELAESLYAEGAVNINYVGGDPIPNTHTILGSMLYQVSNVTQLWNSNLYCSLDTMRLISDVIDVWLPDFKYGNDECAARLSGVKDYFDVVSRNHKLAYESGEVIVRHLVLPGHLECCTFPILDWISKNIPNCMVNIMGQYRPEHLVLKDPTKFKDISRLVTSGEMQAAYRHATELGICWEPVS